MLRSGICREALPEVCNGSGGLPGGLGGVGRPIRRSGRSWEAHVEVQYMLRGPPGGPGLFRRPSRWSGRVKRLSQ